ncbi:MAG: hypothetical protein P1S46_06710 [bacterium]|nr:hypothetical protein [bacterium]MDT8394881.1 hypothetical protein [bacterium]
MATLSNYMVKVTDAKMPEVKKALEAAGIEVRSIIQVHKEETGAVEETAESVDA